LRTVRARSGDGSGLRSGAPYLGDGVPPAGPLPCLLKLAARRAPARESRLRRSPPVPVGSGRGVSGFRRTQPAAALAAGDVRRPLRRRGQVPRRLPRGSPLRLHSGRPALLAGFGLSGGVTALRGSAGMG